MVKNRTTGESAKVLQMADKYALSQVRQFTLVDSAAINCKVRTNNTDMILFDICSYIILQYLAGIGKKSEIKK